MLTCGDGDGAYAHYSTAFWPGDSNFTISSICQVLRALEQPPMKDSKELFIVPLQNSFFEALLHGKSKCSTSILPSSSSTVPPLIPDRPVVPLSKKLFLQLENSAKDNKNRCHGILLVVDSMENLQGGNGGVPSSQPHSRGHRCAL